ncbi:hypothetical protein [Leptospira santarosai]|uniref:Uncharacterized protein n=1 Tax=Leptospira santarosai serovar Shermani str. LT 821 TaxID=758847 RepID=K8XUQ0_9LEPT|nr:hypothetical protein [Leptospira santarosai]EKS07648.1 hypothetical protein LEP1GSC071_0992 [Leptospira santarosai str. JET]EKT85149.1 hypothetical protein LSS_19123 [Leptospira santarosai serovar Shermani str. LT 821]EMF91738.1 hypothetical protein LEP1GSC005_2195 [Leptospira santarosai str. ST188]EMO99218.1 hypothetical protein LEP1GSC120_1210 [Leptospira santarosai str. 200702252]EMP02564.1 hypothetical protein LEP1GSC171_2311 [Leptospira santarosai str. HAI1380]EPG83771.1 hypothetical 
MEERIKNLEYSNSLLIAILETLYPLFSKYLSTEQRTEVVQALTEAKGING